MAAAGAWQTVVWVTVVPIATGFVLLLVWMTPEPLISRWTRKYGRAPMALPQPEGAEAAAPVYHRILVTLDHTALDRLAVSHAAAMAQLHGARIYLLHVEEGVTSQVYGQAASTAETEAGEQYLERIAQPLRDQGLTVETSISHSVSPTRRSCATRRRFSRPGDHGRARARRAEGPDFRQHRSTRCGTIWTFRC